MKTLIKTVQDRFAGQDCADTLRRQGWEQDRIAFALEGRGGCIEMSKGKEKIRIEW